MKHDKINVHILHKHFTANKFIKFQKDMHGRIRINLFLLISKRNDTKYVKNWNLGLKETEDLDIISTFVPVKKIKKFN